MPPFIAMQRDLLSEAAAHIALHVIDFKRESLEQKPFLWNSKKKTSLQQAKMEICRALVA